MCGGGAYGGARGASLHAYGNEYVANYRGVASIEAGNPGTTGTYDGMIILYSTAAAIYAVVINRSAQIVALPTYSAIVGATNRDLYVDNTGLIGYVSSSLQYKTNIRDLTKTDWLHDLRPVLFDWKDGSRKDDWGLVAEEVELVQPALVSYAKNGQPETVSYSKLVVPLLAEVQRLRAALTALEARL